jgi:hypothetical protein
MDEGRAGCATAMAGSAPTDSRRSASPTTRTIHPNRRLGLIAIAPQDEMVPVTPVTEPSEMLRVTEVDTAEAE